MSRRLCMLLTILTALLLLVPTAFAFDVQETLYSTPDDLALFGGKLYAMCYDGLYTPVENGWRHALDFNEMQLGDRYLTPLQMDAEKDELYLLSALGSYGSGETVYRIYLTTAHMEWLTGLEPVCTLDLIVEPGAWVQCSGFVVEGAAAYALLQTDISGQERSTLYRIDLTTGACTLLLQEYISQLQSWKDGLLIARYQPPVSAWSSKAAASIPTLVSIHPATGEISHLADMPSAACGGLTYDVATDAVYVSDQSRLYRFDSSFAQAEHAGRMLPSTSTRVNMAAIVQDDQYIIADWEDASALTITAISTQEPAHTLRITSNYALSDVIRSFARENPDIAIVYVHDAPYEPEDRLLHMQGEEAADLYDASLSSGELAALVAQNGVFDLSGSALLTETVSAMYPHMTRSLLADGQLYALPIALNATLNGYYSQALASAGLSTEQLPSTMDELLDFVLQWYEASNGKSSTIQLWEYSQDLRSQLFGMILTMQLSLCESRGESPVFNTPTVHHLLNKLDRVMTRVERMRRSAEVNVENYQDYLQNAALFMDYYDPMPSLYGRFDTSVRPLLLSLDDTSEPVVSASMQVLYVNPHSDQTDVALRLLEYIAAHLPQDFRIAVFPDENKPIEYAYYDFILSSSSEAIQELETQLMQAEDASEKEALQESLQWMRQEHESILQRRWAFTQEDIAAYREMAAHLVVSTSGVFATDQPDAAMLMQRYLNREISTEQFLRELDRILGSS